MAYKKVKRYPKKVLRSKTDSQKASPNIIAGIDISKYQPATENIEEERTLHTGYDLQVTAATPTKGGTSARYELNFKNFFDSKNVKFQNAVILVPRNSKAKMGRKPAFIPKPDALIIFDAAPLEMHSVSLGKYGPNSARGVSRAHVKKLFEIMGGKVTY